MCSANLSNSYFTNRQDRCIEFQESTELADFFSSVLETVCSHSFSLEPDGSIAPPPIGINPLHSSTASAEFKQSLRTAVEGVVYPTNSEQFPANTQASPMAAYDTVVYPLVQMGQVGVQQDQRATERLLRSLEAGSMTYLASGYFNIPASYTDIVLQSPGKWNVLAASPQVRTLFSIILHVHIHKYIISMSMSGISIIMHIDDTLSSDYTEVLEMCIATGHAAIVCVSM